MKRMLLVSMTFYTIVTLLTGCQQKTLSFEGKGDYWEGSYISNQTSNSENGEFMFGYTGEESIGEIEYFITSRAGDSSGNINVDGKVFTRSTACSGCAKTVEDDEFHVVIQWDGKEDSFTLKR
ncbi:hypothetical protein [Rossellomorea aquimaris]|nr:hypothetical protein [Rossellomorea aquimaris]